MIVETTNKMGSAAGASPDNRLDWRTINWSYHNRVVSRLQSRITKATAEGRWGKVNALQRVLVHSLSGKLISVRRVTENDGKRTAGTDGDRRAHV